MSRAIHADQFARAKGAGPVMAGSYSGAELKTKPARSTATDTREIPTRIGSRLHYKDGRVTDLDGVLVSQKQAASLPAKKAKKALPVKAVKAVKAEKQAAPVKETQAPEGQSAPLISCIPSPRTEDELVLMADAAERTGHILANSFEAIRQIFCDLNKAIQAKRSASSQRPEA